MELKKVKFEIMQDLGIIGIFKICDWEDFSEEEAVKNFLNLNNEYRHIKGYIYVRETK
jgi:hypothetical protein